MHSHVAVLWMRKKSNATYPHECCLETWRIASLCTSTPSPYPALVGCMCWSWERKTNSSIFIRTTLLMEAWKNPFRENICMKHWTEGRLLMCSGVMSHLNFQRSNAQLLVCQPHCSRTQDALMSINATHTIIILTKCAHSKHLQEGKGITTMLLNVCDALLVVHVVANFYCWYRDTLIRQGAYMITHRSCKGPHVCRRSEVESYPKITEQSYTKGDIKYPRKKTKNETHKKQ